MIEMGVDIWQGTMSSNNIPELISKYGGQITFMGGIDSASIDRPDWNMELVEEEIRKVCKERHQHLPRCIRGSQPGNRQNQQGNFFIT